MKYTEKSDFGYASKNYGIPTKRYCQTLSLRDDPKLIAEYRSLHSKENAWKEIIEGIRSVGILEMEMYIFGTTVCMIVETPLDFDWKKAMEMLATLPRQQEWENVVSVMQGAAGNATSAEKWHLMEKFFYLYE